MRVFDSLLLGVMVGISGCATRHPNSADVLQDTWQQSESACIELGVRDKSSFASFAAVFEVTGPDGVVHNAHARIRDNDFSYVTFPSDFGTYMMDGRYQWQCLVESNSVASGAFESHRVAGHQEVRILD